jgi:general secretion pathway protein K
MNNSFKLQRGTEARRGAILIVVLWVVLLLSLMVSTFAFTMQIESKLTTYHDRELRAKALAMAGVEYEKALLAAKINKVGQINSSDGSIRQFSTTGADYYSEPWRNNPDLINHPLTDHPEDGAFTVQVVDEQSKLNANVMSPDQWKTLLRLSGVDADTVNIIVDSIGDWIDKDSSTKMNGAEDDYYMALSPDQGGPYHCKNSSLDRIEELLLVRGMTPDIFYGHQAQSSGEATYTGIAQYLTTVPFLKINVNTASSQVLQCIPGVTAQMAEQLIRYRQGDDGADGTDDDKPFQDAGAVSTVWNLSGTQVRGLGNYLGASSAFFTIYSTGSVGNVRRMVVTTVFRDNGGAFTTISWNEVTPP